VSGLTVRDYIVASGNRWRQYPLIDAQRAPYDMASAGAIEAIIRHPQASARHFLRATTGTEGKAVMDNGTFLLAPEDQELQVSAFVHTAVEGGLLYVEYVSTVLGSIKADFHEIDQLPMLPERLLGRALGDATRRLTSATLMAPFSLIAGLSRALAVNARMNAADRQSEEGAVYNYGARESIREIASKDKPDTYVRRLDAEKYSKLIERRVNDAVLDYLEARHVDTSEYRARANVIYNANVYVQDSTINGPVAAGHGAAATSTSTTTTITLPVTSTGQRG
jgi:hypothetical protein